VSRDSGILVTEQDRLTGFLGRESTLLYFLGLWLALVQISIAVSQILLGATVLLWLYQLGIGERRLTRLPLDAPILLFAATSLAAAAFSFDPATSLTNSKKLALLVVPYLVVSAIRRVSTADRLILLLILMADLGALYGIWQYFFSDLGDLNHRIRGFMSHYMTFSGLLMGVSSLALARLLFVGRPAGILWASLALLYFTLALTLTRSAWIGVAAAAALLFFLRDRRLLVILPLALGAALVLLPRDVRTRVESSVVYPDRSGRDRWYMAVSGLQMVRAHPWFGVGLDMVKEVYPLYLVEGAPHSENIHLHNNLSQIAAERGLLCLAAWVWLVALALAASFRAFRRSPRSSPEQGLAAGSLAFVVATLTAGLFEYNFGDSEVLMLFLFIITLPYALERGREPLAAESR
jgi:O-antigen ligase